MRTGQETHSRSVRAIALLGSVALTLGLAASGLASQSKGDGSMPPNKDTYTREQEKIHQDLAFEKVFIPPRGVPAYVIYMEAKAQDFKPAVIMLHGGEAGAADKTQTIPWLWPIELARMGYVVVCTDAWGCGEHPGVQELRGMQSAGWWEKIIPRIAETARDNTHVYEYLAARPDVDGARIGLMGVSGGAMTTLATAMVEDRFAAYVAVNGACDFFSPLWKEHLFYKMQTGRGIDEASDELRERIKSIDPVYHPEKFAPKPLLFVHGRHDQMAPPIFTKSFHEKLVPFYAETPERLSWRDFDAYPLPTHRKPHLMELAITHGHHPAIALCAYEWLEKYVKGPDR